MALVLLTAPGEEPITLAEAKLNQRVEHNADDTLITWLIVQAREQAEKRTGRQLITASWRLTLDAWPENGLLEPPLPPLISVQSVKYVDSNGAQQTLSPSAYQVDTASRQPRVAPSYGTTWPSARASLNAIQVDYTAGYGSAAAVPASIKGWMHLAIGAWYENRSAVITGNPIAELPADFAAGLLSDYIVHRI